MKLTCTVLTLLICGTLSAQTLTSRQVQDQISVTGEIFVLDSSGQKIIAGTPETRKWKFGNPTMDVDWSNESRDYAPIALRHHWEILSDGRIKVSLEQFEKISDGKNGPTFSKSLKKDEFILTDFAPIVWRSVTDKEKHVIVRLTPTIDEMDEKFSGELPISGTGMMAYDNSGLIWTNHFNVQGKYIGMITHKGAVFMSLYPFQGSKEIGSVSGTLLTIGQIDSKRSLMVHSSTPFLPNGMRAPVYGIVRTDLKTKDLSKTRFLSSSKEENFLKRMEESLRR